MVEPIFPEATIGPIFYMMLGVLITLVAVLSWRISKLRNVKEEEMDLKRLKMPESRSKILEEVLQENIMQSDLPDVTNLSKATVSQALKELNEEDLIIRKKRGNSYLIEPKRKSIEELYEDVTKN